MKNLIVQIKWWRNKNECASGNFNAELYVKVCEAKLKLEQHH